jgi:hypothetical protein
MNSPERAEPETELREPGERLSVGVKNGVCNASSFDAWRFYISVSGLIECVAWLSTF